MRKEQWAVLLAFLAGIIAANLLEKELLTTYGILNDYFLSQYSYQAIDDKRLFCHILVERGKAAFIIFLLGRVLDGRVFVYLVKSMAAASLGFLFTAAIMNMGIRGLVLCVCGLFPQWLFYFVVLFYYGDCKRDAAMTSGGIEDNGRLAEVIVQNLLLGVGMTLGIITECYINPILLACVLKIF